MTVRPRLVLACLVMFVVPACGAGATTTASSGQRSGPDREQSSASRSESDPTRTALRATTLAGAPFDFTSLSGRPTVLWFWAPWCTICRVEAPEIAAAAARLEEAGVTVLGVPGRGDEPAMRQFVADTGVGGFEHVVDTDGQIWSAFGVVSQPAFAFIDAAGDVEVVNGAMTGEELERAARALLR